MTLLSVWWQRCVIGPSSPSGCEINVLAADDADAAAVSQG